MKIKPVILCGGAGTRLWPKSKKNLAKQFIDFGGWTLFEKTLIRIRNPIFDYPIISTNLTYLKLVRKHLLKFKINKYKIILEPLKKKFESFGAKVFRCNGHNIKDLHKILSTNNLKKPKIIIADTTKGKGVSFMENNNMWHYKNPNIEQLNKAIKEINKKYA